MTFENQASLLYNGASIFSNSVSGTLTESLIMQKNTGSVGYKPDEEIFYNVLITNLTQQSYANLTLLDDFGRFIFNGLGRFPLNYVYASERLYIITTTGVRSAPVTAQPTPFGMEFVFDVPAMSSIFLTYGAFQTQAATPAVGASITNTANLSGAGLSRTVTASNTLPAAEFTDLQITKNIVTNPVTVGVPLQYDITVSNYGNTAMQRGDFATISDVI